MDISTRRPRRSGTPFRGKKSFTSSASPSHRGGSSTHHSTRPSTSNNHSGRSRFSGNRFPGNRSSHSSHSGHSGHSGNRGGRKMSTFDVSKYINKTPVDHTPEARYMPVNSFADFNLEKPLFAIIEKSNLTFPTPIQDKIIPHILNKLDVVGLANTGTGKTAAFLIPLINLTLQEPTRQTLILTPTRELALQVEQELKTLSTHLHIYSTICVGGANIRAQISNLRRKNHFIIGTPGRMLDLINRKALVTKTTSTVVLDEADRMLDMGFINDIRKILKDTPKERETLFFSATMSKNVETLIRDFSRDPITVSVKKKDITNNIAQDVVRYGGKDKFETLASLLSEDAFTRVIVFGAMKHSVRKLSEQLNLRGISSESIHGNKSHSQRVHSLKRFKDGKVKVLVATDVAARGLHIDNVSHVINYDLPATYEDYVHRIGRTGRGKESGKALTFVA